MNGRKVDVWAQVVLCAFLPVGHQANDALQAAARSETCARRTDHHVSLTSSSGDFLRLSRSINFFLL